MISLYNSYIIVCTSLVCLSGGGSNSCPSHYLVLVGEFLWGTLFYSKQNTNDLRISNWEIKQKTRLWLGSKIQHISILLENFFCKKINVNILPRSLAENFGSILLADLMIVFIPIVYSHVVGGDDSVHTYSHVVGVVS